MNHISTPELQTVNLMQNDEEHDSCSATPEPRLVVGKKTIVNIRTRFFLFCLIEAGFIILASVCLARPLPLTFGLSDSKVKGSFTITFIVWHSLAVFAGGNITIDAFSREWSVQPEHLVPELLIECQLSTLECSTVPLIVFQSMPAAHLGLLS